MTTKGQSRLVKTKLFLTIGNDGVPQIIISDSILVISKHNSFRVLFDKIASVYLYFSIGNGQPMEPALC